MNAIDLDQRPAAPWPPPPESRRRSADRLRRHIGQLARAVLFVAVLVGLAVDRSPLAVVVAVFVLVVPFEKLFPRHRQRIRRPGVGTDLAYALSAPVLRLGGLVVALPLAIVSLTWLPGLALRPLVTSLGPVPRAVLGVVLFDLGVYWAHRFGHEVPFLWRFHSIHHSSRQLDWISGFRAHPLDGAFLAPAFVLLVAAGFPARFTGAVAAVQIVVGLFLHANVRWRWRLLQKVVNTPELHHWHHADEADAINTNYAALFPVWDLAFGTFHAPADCRPQLYGVHEPLPDGIVRQLWHPFGGLRSPLTLARHPWRAANDVGRMAQRGVGQMLRSARGQCRVRH